MIEVRSILNFLFIGLNGKVANFCNVLLQRYFQFYMLYCPKHNFFLKITVIMDILSQYPQGRQLRPFGGNKIQIV
ncbi:MAG: hypothetical protein COC08_03235 [Maribacter sp.]|nr:MAG: hypothetical protein COC08_03235 [Maribacter sp.]